MSEVKKLTETHEKVYNCLGEDLCKKLDEILGVKTLNMNPIISHIKRKRVFHLWKEEKLTIKQIAEDVKLTEVRIYQILNS